MIIKRFAVSICLVPFILTSCAAGKTQPIALPTPKTVIISTSDLQIHFVSIDCLKTTLAQTELNECAAQKAKDSQQKLDQLVAELQLKYSGTDQGSNLIQIQKEWSALRDKDCLWEGSFFEGGSVAPMFYSLCLFNFNSERINRLKLFLCEGVGMTGPCEASKKYDELDPSIPIQP